MINWVVLERKNGFMICGLLEQQFAIRDPPAAQCGIIATTDLESFTADVDAEANALGDAATDFLNIDLGL